METKLTVKFKRGGKRPKSHGGYSFLTRGETPENRLHILKYLMAVHQGLIQDLGPLEDNLSTAQMIMIDRVTTKLGVIRCMEEYVKENSVMTGNDLSSCLKASYLAYNNSLRLDLQAIGFERKDQSIRTPFEVMENEEIEKNGENS
jgi:hypothetical protein